MAMSMFFVKRKRQPYATDICQVKSTHFRQPFRPHHEYLIRQPDSHHINDKDI